MRFVFTPPADHAAGLLTLPWSVPLAAWIDERLVEIRQRGISRHVVRFVYDDGTLYALKELSERLARREYRLLRAMADLNIPAVEAVGIAVDLGSRNRGSGDDAIRATKFSIIRRPTGRSSLIRGGSSRSTACWTRWWNSWSGCTVRVLLGRLLAVQHAVRLRCGHPGGVPGRRGDQRTSSGADRRQRAYDIELATERVAGELLDLQSAGLLPYDIDPFEIAEELCQRYQALWQELTREEILRPEDQRRQIAERLHRLNKLGFDAEEVELIPTPEGNKLRVRTRVAETGHFARQLFLRTGIDAGENQARRLLNDIAGFRAYLEQKEGHPVSEIVAANRWLEETYDPVIAAIPDQLRGRLPRPRSSTRSSSTAGTCRRPRAATSAPPPRPGTTSSRCCPRSPSRWPTTRPGP